MRQDATAAAKELHDKGYERVPKVCEKRLLEDVPSMAKGLTDPSFVQEVDVMLAQMWPASDTWKHFTK